ncbi:hypothetical protein F5879DRAFT_927788, partial [Lentinula edodes]
VELPGVRRQHVKVTIGYSPIFKQRNIAVWGMSLAPYWPVDRIVRLGSLDSSSMPIVPRDEQLHTGELRRPVAPSNHATMAQPHQLMTERVHGEFYRLLAVPNNAQDVTAILSNGILLLTIKCDEPLTHDEIRVTQEVVEPILYAARMFDHERIKNNCFFDHFELRVFIQKPYKNLQKQDLSFEVHAELL